MITNEQKGNIRKDQKIYWRNLAGHPPINRLLVRFPNFPLGWIFWKQSDPLIQKGRSTHSSRPF
jgi:hypothetical protein